MVLSKIAFGSFLGIMAVVPSSAMNMQNAQRFVQGEWTPLHGAAVRGHTDEVERLLGEGYNPNAEDADGNTPLYLAAWKKHLESVVLLLQKGGQIPEDDEDKKNPLTLAIYQGDAKMVKAILDNAEISKSEINKYIKYTEQLSMEAKTVKARSDLTLILLFLVIKGGIVSVP